MKTATALSYSVSAGSRNGPKRLSWRPRQGLCAIRWPYILVLGLCGLSAPSAEPTYRLFGREVGGYSSKEDVPAIIAKELGPRASLADWDEIKRQYGQSEAELKAFCDKLGLAPERSASVAVHGQRFWEAHRQYFIYRADHKVPADFMVHAQMQDNFLLLGSWVDARPVLIKVIDYNSADAAKWAKWDAAFKEAAQMDISGSYSLVSVDGKKLPATVLHEGGTMQVRSGTFTIATNGRCVSKITFVPPSGVESTIEVRASSTREGPKLRMQWEGAGTTVGTIAVNRFTMENEGMVFAYEK